jgi:hypothetical protein
VKTYLPLLILIIGAMFLYAIQVTWGANKHIGFVCLLALILLGTAIRCWVKFKN